MVSVNRSALLELAIAVQDERAALMADEAAIAAIGPSPAKAAWERFKVILSDGQMRIIDDAAPMVAVCRGRRSGKTTAVIGKVLKLFAEFLNARIAYLAPTEDQGVKILWDELTDYNRQFELGLRERPSDMEWWSGGSSLEVFSFDDKADVEHVRGRKFHLVIIDEAQLAKEWFTEIVKDAIEPTTLDFLGQILVCGTPARVADGYFFDVVHDPGWSTDHHGTAADNPFFTRQGRDPLAEARQRFNLTETDARYKREWLGKWIVDKDELVFFIPDEAVRPWDGTASSFVLGLDLGWSDRDAITCRAVSPLRNFTHAVHAEEAAGQTMQKLLGRVLVLLERFPGPVVYDWGGLGHKMIESLRVAAPKISWVEAEKSRKLEFIEFWNSDHAEGKAFVDPSCTTILRDAKRVRWKRPGKIDDAKKAHSDVLDGDLYAWRRARQLLRELPASPPPKKAVDPFDAELARAAAEANVPYMKRRLREVSR